MRTGGRTDRHDGANSRFSQIASTKKTQVLLSKYRYISAVQLYMPQFKWATVLLTYTLLCTLNILHRVFSLRNAKLGRYQVPRSSIVFVVNSSLATHYTCPRNFEVLCKIF